MANQAIHGTFLSLKKVKKREHGNYGSIFTCDLEKCPTSLYLLLQFLSDALVHMQPEALNIGTFKMFKNFFLIFKPEVLKATSI